MSSELKEIQTKDEPVNPYSEARDERMLSLRKGEPAAYMEIRDEFGKHHDMKFSSTKWWTRFLGLMIIVNLVFTIICIAIYTQLRTEVLLLKQEKNAPSQNLAGALADKQKSNVETLPSSVTSTVPTNCEKGDRGLKGETGNNGMQGPIGPKGERGYCGQRCVNGTKGEKGSPGMTGLPGNQGPQGIGVPGERGPPGIPGRQGPQGDLGIPGYNGSHGLKGDLGQRGPQGLKGSKGDQGERGVRGATGNPGLPGIGGAKGGKGDPGSSGLNGLNGTIGQRGEKGERGPKGNIGSSGLAGVKGAKGEPGEIPDITSLRTTIQQLQRRVDASRDIRLVSTGDSRNVGRVEILHNGEWGTICDDSFGTPDGAVVCRMLGYAGVSNVRGSAAYGQGSGRIWLDEVRCSGSENDINLCTKNSWGDNDCSHSEDVSVVCRTS